MFDLKDYEGFCIEQQDHSPEANAISLYCLVKDIKLLKIKSKTGTKQMFLSDFIQVF